MNKIKLTDLVVVSSNPGKIEEINSILGTNHKVSKADIPEIQSLSLDEVITAKAKEAYRKIKKPVLVTDVSLEIDALGSLPGPFVKYFLKTLSAEKTVGLIRGKNTRTKVTDAIAIFDGKNLKIFKGQVYGHLIPKAKGRHGFGFDFVFIPEGYNKTYAQMSPEEKNKISHRAIALMKLKKFLNEQSKSEIYIRATNPRQYDLSDVNWPVETKIPIRELHFRYWLIKNIKDLKDKTCLDIGCGTGEILGYLIKLGAKEVEAIEPSQKNFGIAQKNFPDLKIHKKSLQDFNQKKKYDVITCTMVLNHIGDIEAAFRKIKKLLKQSGIAYIITEDFDYLKNPRHGYDYKVEKLSQGELAILVKRRYGLIADIIRPIEFYKEAARRTGLKLKKHIQMKFTEKLLKTIPRYKSARGLVINHLLIISNR